MNTTIEPDFKYGGFAVYSHDVYPRYSVLAGQHRRAYLDRFETLEEAQRAYPTAATLDHNTSNHASVSPIPPSDFDPADAGESWDEQP